MIVSFFIISFILDGILSNYLSNSLLVPLFGLVSLLSLYIFFKGDNEYYKCAFIYGFFYDIIYTNTFIFYACMFLLMAFIIKNMSKVFASNFLNLSLGVVVVVSIFRTITYLCFWFTRGFDFNYHILFKGIYSSLILNIFYANVLRVIADFIVSEIKKRRYY
ncbi:MAG: rod shape-determining protein MreD [Bacilli bacterium]|nr:rod shape-determining protein MreD [Bacilli bacterium]